MSHITSNPLVTFFRAYGPAAVSSSLFDEFVVNAAENTGCKPLAIDQPLIGQLVEQFESGEFRSVILTGTAGDGKTYTARKVLEKLGGGEYSWANNDKTYEWTYLGRSLVFIKDLSELKEADKDEWFSAIVDSLTGKVDSHIFVICGNDGHLLRLFRDRRSQGKVVESLYLSVRQALIDGRESDHFELHNMSRQPNDRRIDDIFHQISHHPGWESCKGCPLLVNNTQPCPIRLNRDLLLESGEHSLRARIREMVRMASANDQHLSIRQIIMLVINALLGDQKHPSDPLLTCQRAARRSNQKDYDATNPFASILGENLSRRARQQYGAFAVLGEFGVGQEVSRVFDNSLLSGDNHFVDHPFYGSSTFARYREDYQSGKSLWSREAAKSLENQRRRLFFLSGPASERYDPWSLTQYKHGTAYLKLLEAVESSEVDKVPRRITEMLLCGLNRLMTGSMTDVADVLWLCEPWGNYAGPETPFLVYLFKSRPFVEGRLEIKASEQKGGPPELILSVPGSTGESRIGCLKLNPVLFEFISSVADGVLPEFMPHYCLHEVRQFQLQASARTREKQGSRNPNVQEICINGRNIEYRSIEILSGDIT